jgi:hypothetical protein
MKPDTLLARAFRTTDSARAFEHFLPLVADVVLPDGAILRRDVAIALHNVNRAMAVMSERLPELARTLSSVDVVALAELPALALAVVHATDRIPAVVPSAREVEAALNAIRPLRDATLRYLEVVADLGLVPAGRVRAIRAGSGMLDEARDAVAIVALFKECHAALINRHPFTAAHFKELAEKGAWLVQTITPSNGVASTVSARTPEALDRDRLVRLLESRYDALRTAGVVCFGIRDVDAKVPPLWSAARTATPAPEAPEPAPVA